MHCDPVSSHILFTVLRKSNSNVVFIDDKVVDWSVGRSFGFSYSLHL